MKPNYYIIEFNPPVEPHVVAVHTRYKDAENSAELLTKQTGRKHRISKDVVTFEKNKIVKTYYDEF